MDQQKPVLDIREIMTEFLTREVPTNEWTLRSMINVQEFLEGRATLEKTFYRMNVQIFTDPICLKELTLNLETIPKNLNFPSNEEFCKRLYWLSCTVRERLVIFYDAQKSFTENQDFDNLKVVNDLISQANTFEREVRSLLKTYSPSHGNASERNQID